MINWPQKKVRDLVLKYGQFNNDNRNRLKTNLDTKNKNIRCSNFQINKQFFKEREKSRSVPTSFEESGKITIFKKMCSFQSNTECETISTSENFAESEYNIYVLKYINPIVQELLETEKSYVAALKNGISKYSEIFQWPDLPAELNGHQFELFGNVNEIFEIHEIIVLPMMTNNFDKLSSLIEKFLKLFDAGGEQRSINDIYFDFIIRMKNSQQLRHNHATYFQSLQKTLSDPLGINSFLMQPITRPTKYPLLINSILKAMFNAKNLVSKSDIHNCCKLLKQTKELLDRMNKAGEINNIEELPFIINCTYGPYKQATNFEIYNTVQKRRYNGKVFLFNDMIICTEQLRKRLIYRECYPYDHIGIVTLNSNCFRLFYDKKGFRELEFNHNSNTIVNEWIALIGNMLNLFIGEEKIRLFQIYSLRSPNDSNNN